MAYGRFVNEVVTMWLVDKRDDDRKMLLDAPFSYIDPDGQQWDAPMGRVIDGASIPEWLWGPMIGAPFIGDYRRASVVHDIACQDKPFTSDIVHRMFYFAMLCDGTSDSLAKILYSAVKLFGPQWENNRSIMPTTTRNTRQFAVLVHSEKFQRASTLDDVDKLLTLMLNR